MASTEHGAPGGAEHGQDRPDHCQNYPDSPQDRAMDQEPHDEQDNAESDHDRYATHPRGSSLVGTHSSQLQTSHPQELPVPPAGMAPWDCRSHDMGVVQVQGQLSSHGADGDLVSCPTRGLTGNPR
jgi:hypothetical protein